MKSVQNLSSADLGKITKHIIEVIDLKYLGVVKINHFYGNSHYLQIVEIILDQIAVISSEMDYVKKQLREFAYNIDHIPRKKLM